MTISCEKEIGGDFVLGDIIKLRDVLKPFLPSEHRKVCVARIMTSGMVKTERMKYFTEMDNPQPSPKGHHHLVWPMDAVQRLNGDGCLPHTYVVECA